MTQEYPRESIEYVFFDQLSVNGAPPSGLVEYSLSRPLDRPETWTAVTLQGGRYGFLLTGVLEPGPWKVWVRVADAPERSVIEVGQIIIT